LQIYADFVLIFTLSKQFFYGSYIFNDKFSSL